MKRNAILVLATAALTCAVAHADQGRIPLYLPTVIAQAGHYVVTRDIVATAGSAMTVTVNGDFVIDLNGHTLSTTDTGAPVISIPAIGAGTRRVTIRHGTLSDGLNGVRAIDTDSTDDVYIEEVSITGNHDAGVYANNAETVHIVGVIVTAPMGNGIVVDGSAWLVLKAVTVTGAGGDGIFVNRVDNLLTDGLVVIQPAGNGITGNHDAGMRASIRRFTIEGAGGAGVFMEETSPTPVPASISLEQGIITGAGNDGIRIQGFYDVDAAGLSVSYVGASGIVVDGNSTFRLERAVVARTDLHGIQVVNGGQVQIRDCSVNDIGRAGGSGAAGLLTDGDATWFGNTIVKGSGSGSFGIRLMAAARGSQVVDNSVSGFATGIRLESSGNLVRQNTVSGCTGAGIVRDNSGSLIQYNVITGNGGDGILMSGLGAIGNLIEGNQIRNNSGVGINAGSTTNHYRNNMLAGNLGGPTAGGTNDGGNITGP